MSGSLGPSGGQSSRPLKAVDGNVAQVLSLTYPMRPLKYIIRAGSPQSLQCKAKIYEALLGEITFQATITENISIQNVFKICHPTTAQISLANSSIEPIHRITGRIFRASRSRIFEEAPYPDAKLEDLTESHLLHAARLNKQQDSMKVSTGVCTLWRVLFPDQSITPPSNSGVHLQSLRHCERDRLIRLEISCASYEQR